MKRYALSRRRPANGASEDRSQRVGTDEQAEAEVEIVQLRLREARMLLRFKLVAFPLLLALALAGGVLALTCGDYAKVLSIAGGLCTVALAARS